MKISPFFFIVLFAVCTSTASAQQATEAEIRNLEKLELEALLKKDTTALFHKYWSPKMVVNTPGNVVGTVAETKKRFMAGQIEYARMERNVEKVTFNENLAIVMGNEVLVPKGNTDNAGKTVTRRFTNVWMKTNDSWSIVARQSTIISVH
jgi:ketosteroid isomerase-like protein